MEIETTATKKKEEMIEVVPPGSSQGPTPIEMAQALLPNMNRQQRRAWYARHKKKLGLPSWEELSKLIDMNNGIKP